MTQKMIKNAALGALGFGLLGLTACQSYAEFPTQPSHKLHATQVAETVERMELYSRPEGLVLSARDESAVAAFMRDYAQRGTGPLHINRPSFKTGGVAQTDQMLRMAMAQAGVNPSATQSGQYAARPGDPMPVVMSYRVLRTVPQDCGHLPDLTRTASNAVSPNFGCFAAANLAAMIADPRQLLEPLPAGTPNAQRRQVIYDAYITGATTAAAKPAGQSQNTQESGG